MLSVIKRAFDANRLAKELERAECEIAALKSELSSRLMGPSYREVSKSFDASAIHKEVIRNVVSELSPMLERDVLRHLKVIASEVDRQREIGCSPIMQGDVAYEAMSGMYEFRFEARRMGCVVKIHPGLF